MVGDNEQGKNGGEWASLADALFHEEGVPCAISPFVVDGPHLFVEEGGKEGYFREGICNDFEESFAGDTIELVG